MWYHHCRYHSAISVCIILSSCTIPPARQRDSYHNTTQITNTTIAITVLTKPYYMVFVGVVVEEWHIVYDYFLLFYYVCLKEITSSQTTHRDKTQVYQECHHLHPDHLRVFSLVVLGVVCLRVAMSVIFMRQFLHHFA